LNEIDVASMISVFFCWGHLAMTLYVAQLSFVSPILQEFTRAMEAKQIAQQDAECAKFIFEKVGSHSAVTNI